jgi:hypothetical protein
MAAELNPKIPILEALGEQQVNRYRAALNGETEIHVWATDEDVKNWCRDEIALPYGQGSNTDRIDVDYSRRTMDPSYSYRGTLPIDVIIERLFGMGASLVGEE